MFTIKLYRFNKKSNSTKVPGSNEGTSFTCTMKTSSSIINPVIDIKVGAGTIPDYNYAYIQSFKRYYYVTDTVYDLGVWTLTLSVDVLASYKTDIGNSRQYVLRSESNYDGDIIDSLYISKMTSLYDKCAYSVYAGISSSAPNGVRYRYSTGTSGQTSQYFNAKLSDGEFMIGLVGNNATGVNYYAMSYTTFKQFINAVCTLVPSGMTDLTSATANAVFNPLQYITMCRWYPEVTSINISGAVNTLYIGGSGNPVTVSGSIYPVDMEKIPEYWMEITIPRHPDASNYPYKNLNPYSEYNLFFQPFGNIPIDSTKIYGESSLYITWSVDYATGLSHMKVRPYSHLEDNDSIIVDMISEYGVTIPISTLVMDVKTGLIVSGLQWIKGQFESPGLSNISEKVSSGYNWLKDKVNSLLGRSDESSGDRMSTSQILDKTTDTLAAAMGQVRTVGASGSFLAYNSGKPYVYAFFYDQATQDATIFGRPCHKPLVLSTLSGYCLCSNAVVNYVYGHPVESEKYAVIRYLNTGVYLE